jgi:hypothetical protein
MVSRIVPRLLVDVVDNVEDAEAPPVGKACRVVLIFERARSAIGRKTLARQSKTDKPMTEKRPPEYQAIFLNMQS